MTAANTPEDPRLAEALARIAELESSLKRLEALHGTKTAVAAPEPPARKPALDAALWHVIAAAVAAVVPEPHRIVGVQMQPPLNLWAFEGRRAIFYSHQVRRA